MYMINNSNNNNKIKQCWRGSLFGNSKCVIISLICALFYWFAPPKNKWILLGILYFTYLLIAYYDEYLSSRKYTPTYLRHFYEVLKPKYSEQRKMYNNLCPDIARKILLVDIVILCIGILYIPNFLAWKPN